MREPVGRVPSEAGDDALLQPSEVASTISKEDGEAPSSSVHGTSFAATSQAGEHNEQERSRRPTKGIKPYETWEKEEMERRLGELNGCLGLSVSCPIDVKGLNIVKSSFPLNSLKGKIPPITSCSMLIG